jgi:hypothetical protein
MPTRGLFSPVWNVTSLIGGLIRNLALPQTREFYI